jgi:tetratricopeptide (TPR) repeat protein
MAKMHESFRSGRYRIQGKLGAGGMGAVYEAEDTQLNQKVAIKVVRSQELDEESLARFERECQTMSMLSHPNIVSVLDSGRKGDTPFIVMEFIAGQSLKEFISSQPGRRIDPSLALEITRQIGHALQHTHSRGVLHRDIKPHNIMIDANQQAKLADFGIAKKQGLLTLTQTGDVVGTAAYMAPEQALGEIFDARSDLYSLGCVLYEMLAGQPPFPGDNIARVIFSHINDIPSLPRRVAMEISPALEEMIFKLLAKDPSQRYQSADEILEAIDHVEKQADPSVVVLRAVEKRWNQVIVGRDDELVLLRKRLDATLREKGSIVFLTGEVGIGKSQLAHQLEVYAGFRGARFYTGRAIHHKERVPYQPWIGVLRGALRLTPPAAIVKLAEDSTQVLVKLVPELVEHLGEVVEAPSVPPVQQREHLFAAVTRLLVYFSKVTPLVLFLDDLQWVDDSSLQLLKYVAQRIPLERILIICAYREDELEAQPSLAREIAEISREPLCDTLYLKRLNAEQVSEKIRKTLSGQEIPELEAFVYEKTEGNPFFIKEVLHSLLAADHIVLVDGAWEIMDLSQVQVPGSIQAIVEERLTRLSEDGLDVLTMASVIGREFSFATLQVVAERDEVSLVELLDEALQAQILMARHIPGEEVYTFRDALVKDVLYEAISPVRRHRHYLKVGSAIEQVYTGNLSDHAGSLAYHFFEGNDVSKAAHYSVMAGDKAADAFAWREARLHYEDAVELIDNASLEQRADVLRKLATITYPLADPDASLRYSKQALELYQGLGDKGNMIAMHLHIQTLYTGGEFDGAREFLALEHLQELVSLLEDDSDSVEKGLIYQRMAHIYLHLGEVAKARDWSQRAVNLFDRLSVPMGTALGTALAYTGKIDEGIAYSEGNWESVRRLGNPLVTAIYGHELSLNLVLARDVYKAREWGERVLEELDEAGPVFEGWLRRPLALTYALSGEISKAEETVKKEEKIEDETLLGCYYEDATGIGLHYLRQGDWEAARKYLEQAISSHTERHNMAAVAGCSYSLGIVSLEQQEYLKAEELLLKSLAICRNGGNVLFELWVLPALTELYLEMGQRESAAEYVDRGFELLEPNRNWYGLPALMHLANGLIASAHKKWDEAESSFDTAVSINQQYKLPWDEAKALYAWGGMSAQKRDRESAHVKLDEALAIFQRIGDKNYIQRVEVAKERLGASWFSNFRKRLTNMRR